MSTELYYFSGGPRERVLDAIREAGHRVLGVIVNDPLRWPKVRSTIERAEASGLPVTIVRSKADLAGVIPFVQGKVCFSAGFNYLFPANFIRAASICFNVHGSLLPKYRGMTVGWLIPDGETETGITVHVVDEGTDTGDILFQQKISLTPFDTYRSMMRKVYEAEGHVVAQALSQFEASGRAALRPQKGTPGETRGLRRPSNSEFDPARSMADLIDHIRSCDPDEFPAFFYHRGEKVCVRLWRPDKDASEKDLV